MNVFSLVSELVVELPVPVILQVLLYLRGLPFEIFNVVFTLYRTSVYDTHKATLGSFFKLIKGIKGDSKIVDRYSPGQLFSPSGAAADVDPSEKLSSCVAV